MAFINGLKPIPIEQISLINLTVLLNEFENFPHCRSKLHYVKLEPVVPDAEPVEASGVEYPISNRIDF